MISGVLGGIGQASTETFIENGDVVYGLDIKETQDHTVLEMLKRYGDNFIYHQVDCTHETQVAGFFESLDSIDVLFNIAGGSGRRFGDGPISEVTMEGFDKTIDLNLRTQFLLCKYATQKMLKQGGGCIINTASVLGMVGGNKMFGTHTYAATKGAIIGFSRAMATYYAKDHIRVNVIAPGLIETPMSMRAQNDNNILEYMKEKQPIYAHKDKLGDPYAVAQGALYLAHPNSDFVTGVVLPIDGGWTAQ